ncbi:MAG: hypothetical protein HY847_03390 [Betaproteobacteria bacterium]|nr:hypothetical protein [Betaproteobacteria bacterium]
MKKTTFITTGLSIMLTACATNGMLQSSTGDAKISGTLTRSLFEPYRVNIALDGKEYQGEWRTGEPTREQYLATAWPHKKHIGQVHSVLVADAGSKLDCRWQTHSETGTGSCTLGSHQYPLTLK